jgi:Acyl CoA:acetate/3-ketoacid CoA transferase, beta subunit
LRVVGPPPPGVSIEDVQAATGFELAVADQVAETRAPTDEEAAVLEQLDPGGKIRGSIQ